MVRGVGRVVGGRVVRGVGRVVGGRVVRGVGRVVGGRVVRGVGKVVGVVAGLSVGSSAFAPRRRDRMNSSACCFRVGTPAK